MRIAALSLLWVMLLRVAQAASTPVAEPAPLTAALEPAVRIEWGVQIPMRDGVLLNANLYHPGAGAEKRPAILTMTPYTADKYHDQGMFFAAHGYTFISADIRGRGNSGGTAKPYETDSRDGFDIIAWLARQAWCSCKVGMYGGSYAGFNQWATLKEFPPALTTIVPVASPYPGLDFPAYKNISSVWFYHWTVQAAGRSANPELVNDYDHWADVFRSHYLQRRPFDELDVHAGVRSDTFHLWLSHPAVDSYYDAMVPDAAAFQRMNLPILTITGFYDGVQRGALEFYRLHMKEGSEAGRSKHYVVIGPWNHAGTRKPAIETGGVRFGPKSLIDMNQLLLDWYGWTLAAGPAPAFLRDRVSYYVAGNDEWRYARSLDQLGARPRRMYLDAAASEDANSLEHAGRLGDRPAKPSTRRYVYDPADTRYGEREPAYSAKYLLDQFPAQNLLGAGLVYQSAPFTAATVIAGKMRASLWLRMDVPDTDIEVTLYEIQPDGTSIQLAQDLVRARYRESLRQAALVPAGKLLRYDLPDFQFFARRIDPGSRLRLLIRAPNSIYAQRNFNGGGDVSRETLASARVAHVTLNQGGPQGSYIELPVVP